MSPLKNGLYQLDPRSLQCSHLQALRGLLSIPLSFLLISLPLSAQTELYFNPRFLADDPAAVADLSRFENGQEVAPGTYRVDIYLNGGFMSTRDVTFKAEKDSAEIYPCLTRSQLMRFGIKPTYAANKSQDMADACPPLTKLISGSTVNFNVGQQRLYLTVPQIYMDNQARGYISPDMWDNGINAGLLNYSLTGSNVHNKTGGGNNSYAFLNLKSGVNFDVWRLRDNSTWSYSSGSAKGRKNKWQHVNAWLERDITKLQSRLILGDGYTNGDVFDSVNFRGVQLATDDNMLPDSQKGFAPNIRGIARSTAQVSVKQNGYEIYQTTVPAGPFTINDLYAAGNGGDLLVTIKEADGSSRMFTVPWSSVPGLLREGHTRFALTSGEYRSGSDQQDNVRFVQGTLLHGLPSGWTLYGGTQLGSRYRAFSVGVGKNMGLLGAMSLDMTQANARLPDGSMRQGQSMRFLYNKSLNETGTNIQLMGYRYSTRGFYTLADTAYSRMSGYNVETEDGTVHVKPAFIDYYNLAYNKRGRFQVSVTQQIGGSSTLYLTGSRQTYWGKNRADEQLQAGINSAVDDINWTLSYSLTKNAWASDRDHMLAVNVNIPFSHWLRSDSQSAWRQASASYSMTHDLNGRMTNLAGLYGTALEDNNLSYNVQTGYEGGGQGSSSGSGNASLNYRGGYGNANVGYSRSENISQLYYGMSGGVLAHADGITLSQPLNDTVVLVKAPGAKNARVENQTGVRTDWRGYAVMPYATEYRENRIALDTNTLADNVDLDDAVVSIVPTHGAIVRAEFNARVGVKLLLNLSFRGKPVPFGAIATLAGSQNGSIVADNGQVYLSGMPLAGRIQVKWGEGADAQCTADYMLPQESQGRVLNQLSAECR